MVMETYTSRYMERVAICSNLRRNTYGNLSHSYDSSSQFPFLPRKFPNAIFVTACRNSFDRRPNCIPGANLEDFAYPRYSYVRNEPNEAIADEQRYDFTPVSFIRTAYLCFRRINSRSRDEGWTMIVETTIDSSIDQRYSVNASLTLLGNSTRSRDLRCKDTLSPYGSRLRVRDDYDKRTILDRENLDSFHGEEDGLTVRSVSSAA